jgi:hypothetical protein
MASMGDGMTVICEMSYANRTERERFPETYIYVKGEKGSLQLGPNYWIRVATESGTCARRYLPPRYGRPLIGFMTTATKPCENDRNNNLRRPLL